MKRARKTGLIYKKKGRRRNKWRVRIFVGYTQNSVNKIVSRYKDLGYFKTKQAAQLALKEYLDTNEKILGTITFGQVYKQWINSLNSKLSEEERRKITLSFTYCKEMQDMRFYDINESIIRHCIINAKTKYEKGKNKGEIRYISRKEQIILLESLKNMYDYAIGEKTTGHASSFNLFLARPIFTFNVFSSTKRSVSHKSSNNVIRNKWLERLPFAGASSFPFY